MGTTESLYTAYLEGFLLLDERGRWHHEGTLIVNERVQEFLHRHIHFDQELESFTIRYGKGRATFSHEDVVYFIKALNDQTSPWQLTLAGGYGIPFDSKALRLDALGTPLLILPNGFPARFYSNALQTLLAYTHSENSMRIEGQHITLPPYENS